MSAVSDDRPAVSWFRAAWLALAYYAGARDTDGRSLAGRFGWVLVVAAVVTVVVLLGFEPVPAKWQWRLS